MAALYYALAVRIPISALSDEFGPQGLPMALAYLLGIVAIGLGARALMGRRRTKAADPGDKEREASPARALGLLAIGALYLPFAWLLGYIPAILFTLAGVALYEGMKPSWRMLAVVIGGAALFWLLFVVVLGVPQPAGNIF